MSSPSQIDLNTITEQLLNIIKTCAESNNINLTLQALLKQERSTLSGEGEHLVGLRTQILANAEVLLPVLIDERVLLDNSSASSFPPVQLITSHSETESGQPDIHASVTFGGSAAVRKSPLLFTSKGCPTVTEAFRELLAVSGRLINEYYATEIVHAIGTHEKIEGGGYFTTLELREDDESNHDRAFGSPDNKKPSHGAPTKAHYKETLTAARKAHLLSVEPNASFSFPSDDQSSSTTTSIIEDENPIFSTFPEDSQGPDSSTSPSKIDSFIRPYSRTSSVSSITANAPGCYPREMNSTYKKMRYFEKYDGVCDSIAHYSEYADMRPRRPSKPECRPEYIDDFLSPNTDEYIIESPPSPRSCIDDFGAQSDSNGRYEGDYNNYTTAYEW